MENARCLVFPSVWGECSPLTVPEALIIGLPCIVSDCCAARDFIENGKNSLLFSVQNLETLKVAITKISNDDLCFQLSSNAFEKFKNYRDGNEYADNLLECYAELE